MRSLLSKTRFLAGLQCHRYLWWRVREPRAPELEPDARTQLLFDQGSEVGRRAWEWFPGGVAIELPHWEEEARVRATRRAMAAGAPAVFEATFVQDEIFVAVDVLALGERGGWRLIEVKSSLELKEVHLPDAAVQAWVLGRAGVPVEGVEVMHLNRECVHPHLEDLFVREEVTGRVMELLPRIPEWLRAQKEALAGSFPQVEVGPHCYAPYECPFLERCWPTPLEHGLQTLYQGGRKREELEAMGVETVGEIPDGFSLTAIQARQREAVRRGEVVVEGDLGSALEPLRGEVAFLDFETVAAAIPRWVGCRPHGVVPVQYSCHIRGADGSLRHEEWLASGPGDPRPEMARRLVDLLDGVPVLAAWSAGFEKGCLKGLAEAVPELAPQLLAMVERMVDLLAIVRRHLYHPAFGGSFSLKGVLPALVPGLAYQGLAIPDGNTASAEIFRLLFRGEEMSPQEAAALRKDLLAYCALDTLALVRMVERLEELAAGGEARA